jgi:hypothetical protein
MLTPPRIATEEQQEQDVFEGLTTYSQVQPGNFSFWKDSP